MTDPGEDSAASHSDRRFWDNLSHSEAVAV